jgi:ABC-type multidrug transport system ATPase subunit
VLLLDEPLSGLDATGTTAITEAIRELSRRGVAVVVVEHRTNYHLLRGVATNIWHMENGTLDVAGTAIEKESQLPWYASLTSGESSASRPNREIHLTDARLEQTVVAPGTPRLRFGVSGILGRNSSNSTSITMEGGALALLEAPNGWGKSTFVRQVAGLDRSDRIRFTLDGSDVTWLEPWQRRARGISVLTSPPGFFGGLTVRQSCEVCGLDGLPEPLRQKADLQVSSLSGGEKQLLAVLCTLAENPRIVVLDEPVVGLDASAVKTVQDRVRHQIYAGSVVLVTEPSR